VKCGKQFIHTYLYNEILKTLKPVPSSMIISSQTCDSFCWCRHFGSELNWKKRGRKEWPQDLFSYCLSNKNRGSNHYCPCAVYSMFPSTVCPLIRTPVATATEPWVNAQCRRIYTAQGTFDKLRQRIKTINRTKQQWA
jgi:hypothetical protein